MIKPTSISEQLLFSTVKIDARLNSESSNIGTGFFFAFNFDEERTIHTIITNKHVIKDAVEGSFLLHELDTVEQPSTKNFQVTLDNFEKLWVPHPNPEVDLCAMFFEPVKAAALAQDKRIFNTLLNQNLIFPDSALEELSAVEDVLMTGYPIGLWDSTNNLPLIRKGITATHPAIDFCGKSITVLDIACFPGSSGSPVLLVNEGFYGTKKSIQIGGKRVILIGVLYAGPQIDATGTINIENIPTMYKTTFSTKVMANLGYVIKAKELLALGDVLRKIAREQEQSAKR